MDLDRRVPPVAGDPERIQLVLWHLLSNAVKFSPEGGRVQLRLHRNGETAEVVVADNGIGISPSFLPHVFDRFRQQDMSTTRAYAGVGLGLSLVRHIVELHEGTVSVVSEGDGRGTTVSVNLPIDSA